jgi:mannitol-1-/sugar-/sorbitol-6-phosphatase
MECESSPLPGDFAEIELPGPITLACRAVLFDLDGTLVDSQACVEKTWRTWCDRHRLDPELVLQLSPGRQQHATIALAAPHLDPAAEIGWLRQAEENCREGIVPVPGASDLLASLSPRQWAVVTSGWRRLAEIRLGAAGLAPPPVLVTADEIPASKPAPDGYLLAAERLGVQPADCLVIEDTPVGIAAGRAAGMRTIAVTTTFSAEQLGGDYHIANYLGVRLRSTSGKGA